MRATEAGLDLPAGALRELGLQPGERAHVEIRKLPAAGAIRLAGMRHVLRHLGDAVVVGEPAWNGQTWVALLGVKGRSGSFGKLTLTEDGLVVEELSTTRDELLEKLPASSGPLPATTPCLTS